MKRRAAGVAFALTLSTAAVASAATGGVAIPRSNHSRRTPRHATRVTDSTGHVYRGDSVHMGDRILREGMNGHDVRVLQGYLTIAGFPTPVVGHFGPITKANVIAFERSAGLAPTGVLLWADSQALRAAVARVQKKASTTTTASTPTTTAAPAATVTTTPAATGQVLADGLAVAPASAPEVVKEVIAAGNQIALTPYIYGGGHASFQSVGYDCSGSVSYALHGGGLIASPEDSSQLESYGSPGPGVWITIWTNVGHAYMYVAGLRFDTGAQSSTGGSRWTAVPTDNAGFVERHPTGY